MERDEIYQRVRIILVSVLKHENFSMQDNMTAQEVEGWDSLSHMTIISTIEKEFSITFKLKELNKIKNMGILLDLIESKL